MHDPQPMATVPPFVANCDGYDNLLQHIVACCQKHSDSFTWYIRYTGDEAGELRANGVTVWLNDGWQASVYADFIAALRALPDVGRCPCMASHALPDGDLVINLFAPKGHPVFKLWYY